MLKLKNTIHVISEKIKFNTVSDDLECFLKLAMRFHDNTVDSNIITYTRGEKRERM